ncbi:MAG: 1,6-anhydro-N-acetylmuramyl-L-alanine amidase AmpD [Gammaproteobacteria bacterium]|nr:1,6-anhydro-N-acetylmuramyl-L-alanine amidase AmpD [Gammaproteobacteria bacterium]PCH63875.1 MAG: 1,6-anhydro-N-acetylmuramyl-L-alanine amidase AmpD [Gammaproteobacteria bacterium]
MFSINNNGWLEGAHHLDSPNHDERPPDAEPSLLVIHNISLPPGAYGGPWIDDLFCNRLDATAHPYFAEISTLRVSSHLLIRRDGQVCQYVSLDKRAWHAGDSCFDGRSSCNDFSIGVELEGCDDSLYEPEQYQALVEVTRNIRSRYPAITTECIVGHSDIAPRRKTDPGEAFDWTYFRAMLKEPLIN